MWFSQPYLLNDPFDCSIPFTLDGTDEEYQELFEELNSMLPEPKLDKIREFESSFLTNDKIDSAFINYVKEAQLRENKNKIIDTVGEIGVACFSARLDSILMWSHYADRHIGLCLEFDTNYPPFSDPEKLHRLIYSNSYPRLLLIATFQSSNMPFDPLVTKSKDWEYEEEWRFITDKGNWLLEYEPKALTAIYFGCLMPIAQRKQGAAMPARSAARLHCMERSETMFQLEPAPYHG